MAPALATPPCCCRSLRAPPHHWPVGSCQIPPAQSASYQYGPHVGACRSPKIPPPRRFGGHQCQSLVAFAPPVRHMTGAAGDTTTTDSRSQRNRASRRGGQLLTRALGSSCVSACPHFMLPVPLSRWSHHTPRCRTPQPNVGTEESHTGYERRRKLVRHGAPPHRAFQGVSLKQDRARHDLQVGRGCRKTLAAPRWPQPVAENHPRYKVHRRNGGCQIANSNRCRLIPSVTKIRR